jgi:hypothetical protein
MRIDLDLDDEAGRYFLACARIRNIKPISLFRRLLAVINRDQLVGSILDDADELRVRHKGEHRYSGPKAV